jgi:hypothetical protein
MSADHQVLASVREGFEVTLAHLMPGPRPA